MPTTEKSSDIKSNHLAYFARRVRPTEMSHFREHVRTRVEWVNYE